MKSRVMQQIVMIFSRMPLQQHPSGLTSAASADRLHSDSATPCQAVAMVGTAPSFRACTYASVRPASTGPVIIWGPTRLGCALEKISLVSASTPTLEGQSGTG